MSEQGLAKLVARAEPPRRHRSCCRTVALDERPVPRSVSTRTPTRQCRPHESSGFGGDCFDNYLPSRNQGDI